VGEVIRAIAYPGSLRGLTFVQVGVDDLAQWLRAPSRLADGFSYPSCPRDGRCAYRDVRRWGRPFL
jgi:hypothetical protein